MTLDDIKKIYSDLLIAQYKNKPKARAMIGLMASAMTCDGLLLTEQTCFNLDTAEGAQLDIIGRIVGVNRNAFGLDLTHSYWEMTKYNRTPTGVDMQRYADSVGGPELFLRYHNVAIYTMSDFEMRALIRLKIIFNTSDETLYAIKTALNATFAGLIDITDNMDMTVTYTVQQPYQNMMTVAAYKGLIPKPMGVAYTITNV